MVDGHSLRSRFLRSIQQSRIWVRRLLSSEFIKFIWAHKKAYKTREKSTWELLWNLCRQINLIARVIIFRIIVYIANYDENHFFDDVYCADGMSK